MTPADLARVDLVRADNPSPMTLEGTNTWVLQQPAGGSVVVDVGPADPRHLEAVRATAGKVALVLLTHAHPDHAAGAVEFARLTEAPLRAADPMWCVGGEPLADGERLTADGLEVVGCPGHTRDSVSFVLPDRHALLTGDTLLGRGSTVVAHPEGRLDAYLRTLQRLRRLVDERGLRVVLPGHGPVVDDPVALIEGYLAHRRQRLDEVRVAIAGGAASIEELLARVYGEIGTELRDPARWSLLAQLHYLQAGGEDVGPLARQLSAPGG